MPETPTPKTVNLLNRLTTAEIRPLEFTGEDGKTIAYKRLVLAGDINGETLEVELKVDKKDLTLLSLFALIPQSITEE